MHTTAKYLAGTIGIVVCAIAVFATRHFTPDTALTQVQAQTVPATPIPLAEPVAVQPVALTVSEDANVIPSLPADATSVPDVDLLKLSTMVNLTNAEERHIDKEPWSRAVPIAQKLAQGPCDCEQRNWLVQFIQMGNDALAGSNDDYYRLATVMRKTARNDKQLANDPAFFNR